MTRMTRQPRRALTRTVRTPVPALFAFLSALLLGRPTVAPAGGLRRAPVLQPVAEARRGEILVGLGMSLSRGQIFPVAGLEGARFTPLALDVVYALADRALFDIRCHVYNYLYVDARHPAPVVPDPGDPIRDFGDFRISTEFLLLDLSDRLAFGSRFETTLPNSDKGKGMGTDTFEFEGAILGSFGDGPWRVTGDLGIAIVEAPLENFSQNDLLAYGAEVLYGIPGRPIRLFLGIDGRANTRGTVPLGTEGFGEVRFGADCRVGPWILDAGAARGYAGESPEWRVRGGLARRIGGKAGLTAREEE